MSLLIEQEVSLAGEEGGGDLRLKKADIEGLMGQLRPENGHWLAYCFWPWL
jgi:hypothetical protein